MSECWSSIPGIPYEASTLGRVRREPGSGGRGDVEVLTQYANSTGYLRVTVTNGDGGQKRLVHHLVAEAFIGERPEGHDCHHMNGEKTDNRPGNLEYITRSENVQHAYDTGLRKAHVVTGEDHHKAKLTEDDVREIRRRYEGGDESHRSLAQEFGVSRSHIARIVNHESWGWLT